MYLLSESRVAAESPAGILPRVRGARWQPCVATIREKVLPRRLSTPRLIVVGFLALMALGTVLLKLPVATERGISWVDAMFVSVSAGSVTGLSTVDFPATFTTFGAVVVMVLVQLGGLGIMTVTTMAALFVGQRVGFRNLIAVRESIESVDSPRNILRLLLQIARITFAVELLAAVALSVAFIRRGMAPSEGIFRASSMRSWASATQAW